MLDFNILKRCEYPHMNVIISHYNIITTPRFSYVFHVSKASLSCFISFYLYRRHIM